MFKTGTKTVPGVPMRDAASHGKMYPAIFPASIHFLFYPHYMGDDLEYYNLFPAISGFSSLSLASQKLQCL